MARKDAYYNKAKQEGYRSRAAYKLKQIDDAADVLRPGRAVVDLGAAPGGWLQVAVERGARPVIGVDRVGIRPLEGVETIQGDLTQAETRAAIRDRAREVRGRSETTDESVGLVDVVLSDMAPDMSGEYSLDHARSIHLGRLAFEVADDLLGPGGDFVVKVFDGTDLAGFRRDLEGAFEYVRLVRPDATRDESSEVYLVGKRYLTTPVRAGDVVTRPIEDTGAEGDGVAFIDGYPVFVPGAREGETVEFRITGVKARFGFGERTDTDTDTDTTTNSNTAS